LRRSGGGQADAATGEIEKFKEKSFGDVELKEGEKEREKIVCKRFTLLSACTRGMPVQVKKNLVAEEKLKIKKERISIDIQWQQLKSGQPGFAMTAAFVAKVFEKFSVNLFPSKNLFSSKFLHFFGQTFSKFADCVIFSPTFLHKLNTKKNHTVFFCLRRTSKVTRTSIGSGIVRKREKNYRKKTIFYSKGHEGYSFTFDKSNI
jgi:hypothetical protein